MIFHNFLNFLWKSLHTIDRLIASILCYMIVKLRPLLGPEDVCPFAIGCTNFAIFNLEIQPTPLAFWAIFKRLLTCNPIGLLILNIKQKN